MFYECLRIVEDIIRENIDLPPQIEAVMDKKKKAIAIRDYEELKNFLLS